MTEHSTYTQGYITACDETLAKYTAPAWFVSFFETYREGLINSSVDKSNGNRNFLTNAFADALQYLLPAKGLEVFTNKKGKKDTDNFFKRENSFKELIEQKEGDEFYDFLSRKRMDFFLRNNNGKILIIEFKNTANFDTISSAATEMKLLRDFLRKDLQAQVTTWSISMFCGQSPDSLDLLNKHLDKPIDKIWTFRKWDSDRKFETPFDVKKFIELRTALINFSKS